MNDMIDELLSSWSHCKDLITSRNNLDLVVAFLEEFKVQFTQTYKQLKHSLTKKHQKIAITLIDKSKLFNTQQGELSQFITFIKNNWHAKKLIAKYVAIFDKIISSITQQHKEKNITY